PARARLPCRPHGNPAAHVVWARSHTGQLCALGEPVPTVVSRTADVRGTLLHVVPEPMDSPARGRARPAPPTAPPLHGRPRKRGRVKVTALGSSPTYPASPSAGCVLRRRPGEATGALLANRLSWWEPARWGAASHQPNAIERSATDPPGRHRAREVRERGTNASATSRT